MGKLMLLMLLGLLAVTSAEANDACQADIDGNGIVEFADFLLFSGQYGQSGGEQCAMTVDADSLAVVTALRDSISALQAALGATRFAVATLQTALASETERANENQRLLTASNDAFNSLAQTHCTETEPAAQPEPPGAPAPQPEPPVVIEPQPPVVPPPGAEPEPTPSLSFEVTVPGDLVIKVFLNGLSKPVEGAIVYVNWPRMPRFQACGISMPPSAYHNGIGGVVYDLSPTEPFEKQYVCFLHCWTQDGGGGWGGYTAFEIRHYCGLLL